MSDYKDVYETEDLPEAEQDFEEDTKDCVEKLNINVHTAFNRFKGKEALTNERTKSSKYSMNVNPFDKAKRIITELETLAKEVDTSYDSNNANKNEPVTKEQLLMLIEGLSLQVKELNLDESLGAESSFEVKDPKKILFKKLMNRIDELKFQECKKKSESSNQSYILTSHTEVNDHLNQMKMANLCKRLDTLEKVLGDDNVKLSNIVNECPNKGIVEAVERLTAKTGLLNNPQLDVIESRLGSVVNKLQSLSTVASNATTLDQESQMKIAGLYELVKKWDHVMDSVPGIIDQCVSMQDFHVKSVKLGQCIAYLDIKHQEMSFKQQTSQMALKNIQDSIAGNFETMGKNMTIIDEKLRNLS